MRTIRNIALDIINCWNKVNFGARPYLTAMLSLRNVDDYYGADSADMILRYFLSNATTFRGEDARRIKKEIKTMLK